MKTAPLWLALALLAACPPPRPIVDAGPDDDGGGQCPSTCASGSCFADGGCQCAEDAHCTSASASRCDTARSTCVACLPGDTDNCPKGQFCQSTFTCAPGCKGSSDCQSGQCLLNHDCAACQTDLECGGGRVCSTGTCAAPCSAASPCTGGRTCCSAHCVDTARDIAHCGACTVACSPSQFCTGTACAPTVFTNVCLNPRVTVLLDDLVVDGDAGVTIGNALQAGCAPTPTLRVVGVDAGVINASNGRPLVRSSELVVAAGGSFRQKLVDYLESNNVSPAYDSSNSTILSFSARDGGGATLVSAMESTVTPSHDYFLVELVREPGNGSLSLLAYGFRAPGTQAAAWYFNASMLPNHATLGDSWYLVEWTDGNANGLPDSLSEFSVVGHGT